MDLSCYFEERYLAETKDFPPEKDLPGGGFAPGQEQTGPIELTAEEIKRAFVQFDETPSFQGKFTGPGQEYIYQGKIIKTWAFTDINDLPWLIAQWFTLDESQPPFLGFSKETPGEFIYNINYISKTETENGIRHNIRIFRKKS